MNNSPQPSLCLRFVGLGVGLFLIGIRPVPTAATQPDVLSELTNDEEQAAATITENKLLSTVSFLASDEMAGRNTPSRELTIASAYVAARFRGSGLEGLGPDGSFYQTHQLETVQIPVEGVWLTADGSAASTRLRMLAAPAEDLDISAEVLHEDQALQHAEPQIAVIDEFSVPPQAVSNPAMVIAVVTRRLRALQNKGLKLVLVRCSSDSVLWEAADVLPEQPRLKRASMHPGLCVALVPETDVPTGKVTVRAPSERLIQSPVRNVVGVLRGSDEKLADEAILISAHLDHIGVRGEGQDMINNGADDNATGVTAVLALADAFAALKVRPARSMVFVTFWGEEKGLLGSKEFVKQPLWPLPKIVANINIEMVGRPEKDASGKAWMTGWKHSNLGEVMNAGSQRLGVEIFNRTDVGEMLYRRSDNYSFVQRGVVAHSFSAGSLHSDYHQPSDEWGKLELPHMTKVVRGLFAGALHVASRDGHIKSAP